MECPNPMCRNRNTVFDPVFQSYICPKCGTVIEESPFYEGSDSLSKGGNNPRYSGFFTHKVHDHGIGSTEIAGNVHTHIREGRTWVTRHLDSRVSSREDKKLVKALRELNDLAKELRPPKAVWETAASILQKIVKNTNVKEQTLRKIIAASLYSAYKKCGYPRPARVFAREIGISENDLWEGIRKIREIADIRPGPENFEPRHYVNYITSKLKLSSEVGALASEFISQIKDNPHISGKSPASMAAASVYLASIIMGERRNQLDVGKIMGQTDVAIRNTYNLFVKLLDIDILI